MKRVMGVRSTLKGMAPVPLEEGLVWLEFRSDYPKICIVQGKDLLILHQDVRVDVCVQRYTRAGGRGRSIDAACEVHDEHA